MADPNMFLTAPIPGQSLTVEPGSVPWEQPPQYTTLAEVVKFYTERIDNTDVVMDLIELLKRDIPILTIVNTLVKTSIMKGYHYVDVGFLVTPILVEMIKTIAEVNDVPYTVSYDDMAKKDTVDPRVIKEMIDEMKKNVASNPETIVKEQSKGLMARGAQ